MTDPIALLNALRRPRPLVQAARFALDDYVRERALPRLLHRPDPPAPGPAVLALLLEAEAAAEARRTAGALDYAPARHVELLAAVMAEARLAGAAATAGDGTDQAKASGMAALRRAT